MPPRPNKKRRVADKQAAEEVVSKKLKAAASAALAIDGQALVQFVDPDGKIAGPQLDVPLGTSKEQLGTLLNQLLENAEEMPYSFHLEETEITSNLAASFGKLASQSTEPWMRSGPAWCKFTTKSEQDHVQFCLNVETSCE
eukprot:s2518_g9.t1